MSPAQIAAVIATAEKPREARVLSRLYGYRIKPIQTIESEPNIIRQVLPAGYTSETQKPRQGLASDFLIRKTLRQ